MTHDWHVTLRIFIVYSALIVFVAMMIWTFLGGFASMLSDGEGKEK
jgi:hypothetical protein